MDGTGGHYSQTATSGGYSCVFCGYWVAWGDAHNCVTGTPPRTDPVMLAVLERIATALERLAAK